MRSARGARLAPLRQRVVGGVADQQMAETEAVFACELRTAARSAPCAQGRQAWRHLGLLGRQRLDRAAMKDLPFDRAPLEHAPLAGSSWSSRAARSARKRRRDHNLALLPRPSPASLDEERVAGSGPSDPSRSSTGIRSAISSSTSSCAERLKPKRHRPGRAQLAELRPGHAEEQDRRTRARGAPTAR